LLEAWIPSKKIEVVFRVTRKCIHNECRKRDEYSCKHEYFHRLKRVGKNITGFTLQKVISTTVPLG